MSDSTYKVTELSPDDVQVLRIRSRAGLRSPLPSQRPMLLSSGFELRGEFDLIAREISTGELCWRVSQPNLITDFGRHAFFDSGWSTLRIGFMPSSETPNLARCGMATDGAQVVLSSNLGGGTVTPSTYTKQWSTTFSTPAANRTLGSIFVTWGNGTVTFPEFGVVALLSYSLLTPPKTQTTTQTLEVVYRVAMNPIF